MIKIDYKKFFKDSIVSEKIVLAINKYNQNNIKTVNTITKYFFVSALVGQTTCFNSLKESFTNCTIIKNK